MFSTIDEPEHRRQLRESVASFAARHASPQAIREAVAAQDAFDHDRWSAIAESGWLALLVPEDVDGIGMEVADLSAFHQEIGRFALRDPLAEVALLVIEALVLGSNRTLTETLIPSLIGGELVATLAWQGSSGAMGSADIGPTANLQGGVWHLAGQAAFVPLAHVSQGAVVAARTGEGVVLLWLEKLPVPISTAPQTDGTTLSTLDLTGLQVSADMQIAAPDEGAAILDRALDLARLAISAQLVGAMERALVMTVEYLNTREQFGQPLGKFQALQHRSVELFVLIEITRSSLIRAEEAMGGDAAAANVSAVKSRASEVARKVARECIQLHGAIGYTEEYDLSLYVNRILSLSARLGNASAHRARWFAQQFPVAGESNVQ